MKTQHLQHKHGGDITAFHKVAHSTFKHVASWHYVCDVRWVDGTTSSNVEVAPHVVCYEHDNIAARQEYDAVSIILSDYLGNHGIWNKKGAWIPTKAAYSVHM